MGLNGASAVEDGTTQTLFALLWLAGSLTFLANAFGRAWRTTDMMSGSSHSAQRSGTTVRRDSTRRRLSALLRHLSKEHRRFLTVSVALCSLDVVPWAANLWYLRRTLLATISRPRYRSVDGSEIRGLRG